MPSGTVALSDVDPGLAIDVFDLRLILGVLLYSLCFCLIYFYLLVGRGVYISFRASYLVGRYIWQQFGNSQTFSAKLYP
jgi:hypothetical protein